MASFPGPLHALERAWENFYYKKNKLKKKNIKVGMACQKVCKQGRDESKVTVFAKAHPYIFFTVQLDSAWESSKVHQLLYWQFMAVALYSSHFLLQHGLGMKLAVCLVGNYWVSYLPGSSQWYPWRHYVIQNCLVRILFVIVCKQCVYNPYSL